MASSAYSQALAQFDSGQSQFPGIQHLAQLTGDFIHSMSIYLVNANGTVGQIEFDAQVLKNSTSILPINANATSLVSQTTTLDVARNTQFTTFVGPQLYSLLTGSQSPSKADIENVFALIGLYAGAAEGVPIGVKNQVVPDVSGMKQDIQDLAKDGAGILNHTANADNLEADIANKANDFVNNSDTVKTLLSLDPEGLAEEYIEGFGAGAMAGGVPGYVTGKFLGDTIYQWSQNYTTTTTTTATAPNTSNPSSSESPFTSHAITPSEPTAPLPPAPPVGPNSP
jgi:hypothetical protein